MDDAGKLETREDVYGIDARMLKALKSDERKIADVAVEQRGVGSANVSRDELRYAGRDAGFEGFQNPFLALFGGPRPDPSANNRSSRRNGRDGREARETRSNPGFFGLFR